MKLRTPGRRSSGLRRLMVFCALIGVLIGGYLAYLRYIPNGDRLVPDYGFEYPLVYKGKVLDAGARKEGEELKLPLDALQEVLGAEAPIRYEAESGSIILTTADKVLYMKTDALTATVNSKPFDLTIAAESDDGRVYLPLTPLTELFGLQAEQAEGDAGIVTLFQPGQAIQRGRLPAAEGAVIRSGPTIRATISEQVESGGEVRIWGEEDGWYLVQGPQGYVGYASKSDIVLGDVEKVSEPKRDEPFIAWKVIGSKINLAWEAVYQVAPNPADIGPLPGVNVVSPTWFELKDGKGAIRSKADNNYVAWAQNRNMQVWALFSNGFDPDRTTEALDDYGTRFRMIQQLLSLAKMYKLQGINIDFENVYMKDKANLVQFVREITPLAHDQNLVVSIDVTPKSSSEMWSAFLDREALGRTVDFMVIMAYDEYWASSPTSGPVASLPWVERSVKRILEEDNVPPRKLVLGVPLYTRIWTEKKGPDGKVQVSSKAVGMEAIEELIAERKLRPVYQKETGQHYVEYVENGALNRIWIENETSMKARAELVKKYGLGGIASWQRTFQKPEIWQTIRDTLNLRP
ncbi:MAG TPA: glycosyl hydrolase family 18 protein [Paenibacillus sp.]|uniref:glycosyl hydrolase family 18 protein n=1 Tax=Paenibacillus sp. TaxID=58172 RepID=UPI0028D79F76|nr:glycosyl hydrolase family 18 protein [Paenibacillus sp.]HUC91042.1 glycosyl hydrolase family 18 protein [Paenibacillus sp.]